MHAIALVSAPVQLFLDKHPNGLLVVLGPTASGKTGFSVELAQWVQSELGQTVEIISVDSRQVYRECDISAAKITSEEMGGIIHHGLDLVDLNQPYSVYDWQQYCFATIEDIQARGNIPMLCGGTMLWLDAVTENYIFPEEKITEPDGEEAFPKLSEKGEPRWPCLKLGLQWPREVLYERINQRAVQQFENGLVEETKRVLAKYGAPDPTDRQRVTLSAFTSFGYKEIKAYLDGEMNYEEALALNQQRNRNYAKRQLTWWRGREDVVWVNMT